MKQPNNAGRTSSNAGRTSNFQNYYFAKLLGGDVNLKTLGEVLSKSVLEILLEHAFYRK